MIVRWKKRQIKKKIRNFQISENISFDKIGGNPALSPISTKICLLTHFYMQNSYLR